MTDLGSTSTPSVVNQSSVGGDNLEGDETVPCCAKECSPIDKVVIHPMVLLSVVDHFNRMNKAGEQKRVVGILLGSSREKGLVDVSNSFAVPFTENDIGKDTWTLDPGYLENMYSMFEKVNSREKIVGWYHTGPKISPHDIEIDHLIKKYCPNSVLVIVDPEPNDQKPPIEAYFAVERRIEDTDSTGSPDQVHDESDSSRNKIFESIPAEIITEEAEEVVLEHLLRDVK